MVGCLKYLGEKKWSLKKFEDVMKSKKGFYVLHLRPHMDFIYRELSINLFLLAIEYFLLILHLDSALTI